jgi:hypothetical protein
VSSKKKSSGSWWWGKNTREQELAGGGDEAENEEMEYFEYAMHGTSQKQRKDLDNWWQMDHAS